MKEKYNIPQDKYDFDITTINDQGVIFVAKFLLSEMLCKMWPNKCIAGTISAAEQCAARVQMSWVMFLLNELLLTLSLVQNEELATKWLKILVTIGFSSDLLLNMSNFDWSNYKQLKLTTNLVTS